MSAAVQRVTEALLAHGSRQEGGLWACPAHEDRTPSLQVAAGGDGRALVRCFADCPTEDVVAALGLRMADLFAPNGVRRLEEAYRYTDEAGELLFEVARFSPKSFRQRRPDGAGGWIWSLGDTRRVLYRLPEVVEAVRAGRRVWVVEGEKDAHALEAAGEVATCNPGGAGKWRDEFSCVLSGAEVVVVADRDETGGEHAAKVARSLGGVAASVRVVEAAEGKDAADHLAAGLGVEQFTPVDRRADQGDASAPMVPDSWAAVPVGAAASGGPIADPPALVEATEHEHGGPASLFYRGRLNVPVGPPESVKTWLAAVAVAEVARAGGHALWLDFDSMGAAGVEGRLRALGAGDEDLARVFYVSPEGGTAPEAEAAVGALAAMRSWDVVVVDAWDPAMFTLGLDPYKPADTQRFHDLMLRPFGGEGEGAAVIVPDHVVKDKERRDGWAGGSQRKKALSEFMVSVELVGDVPLTRETPGTYVIRREKDRPAHHRPGPGRVIGEVTFTPQDGGAQVDWTLRLGQEAQAEAARERSSAKPRFRPTGYMERASLLVEAAPEPMSLTEVEKAVGGKSKVLRAGVERLVEEGYLVRERGPRGAFLHTSAAPFRESDDPGPDRGPASVDRVPPGWDGVGTGSFPDASDGVAGGASGTHRGPTASLETGRGDFADGYARVDDAGATASHPVPHPVPDRGTASLRDPVPGTSSPTETYRGRDGVAVGRAVPADDDVERWTEMAGGEA